MTARLPIFPLSTVLVPGLILPLHIHEPRYRVLIEALRQLPDSAPKVFGIVALRWGRESGGELPVALYSMGCTATLREVSERPDGKFDIVVIGESRFHLRGLDAESQTPYLTGFVDLIDDAALDSADPEPTPGPDLQELTEQVALAFAAYREQLDVEQSIVPTEPRVLSYLITAAAVLERHTRQTLFEMPTTAERLRAQRTLLRRETRLIPAFRSVPALDLESEGPN